MIKLVVLRGTQIDHCLLLVGDRLIQKLRLWHIVNVYLWILAINTLMLDLEVLLQMVLVDLRLLDLQNRGARFLLPLRHLLLNILLVVFRHQLLGHPVNALVVRTKYVWIYFGCGDQTLLLDLLFQACKSSLALLRLVVCVLFLVRLVVAIDVAVDIVVAIVVEGAQL